MPFDVDRDPLYRALLAEVADLEWQIVEENFSAAMSEGSVPLLPVPSMPTGRLNDE